jgi:hypothetical protein
MKLHNIPLTEHSYNELIRVYAGACLKENVMEKHVEMYINDAWSLFETLQKDGLDININILNSMTYLYVNALRPEELEARVLPLYTKYKVK